MDNQPFSQPPQLPQVPSPAPAPSPVPVPTPTPASIPAKKNKAWHWLLPLILAFPTLFLIAILQIIAKFASSTAGSSQNPIALVINLISILLGITAVISIMLAPLWIILFAVKQSKNS